MQMNHLANVPPSVEALPSRQRDVPSTLALDIVTRLLLAPGATRRGRGFSKAETPNRRIGFFAASAAGRAVARPGLAARARQPVPGDATSGRAGPHHLRHRATAALMACGQPAARGDAQPHEIGGVRCYHRPRNIQK